MNHSTKAFALSQYRSQEFGFVTRFVFNFGFFSSPAHFFLNKFYISVLYLKEIKSKTQNRNHSLMVNFKTRETCLFDCGKDQIGKLDSHENKVSSTFACNFQFSLLTVRKKYH